MPDRAAHVARRLSTWLERLLALAILVGVVVFALQSAIVLAGLDWRATETFYELIYRTLMLVISVELVRTLVTHDLRAVVELIAFVLARKVLKPELPALDILMVVIGFVALLAARRHFLPQVEDDAAKEPR